MTAYSTVSNQIQITYPELTAIYNVQLDENPAAVYLASLSSERSRKVMEQTLRSAAALLTGQNPQTTNILAIHWSALRYPHTAALRARLLEVYSPATVNRTLSAIRGVLKEAWRLGQMTAEDYRRAVDVRNIKAETLPAGRELDQEEISALAEVCRGDRSPSGPRDTAILALLYTCGLRRAEIVALDVRDFEPETGKLRVLAGKGRKQRTVYAQGSALRALLAWLHRRSWTDGPLFLPVLKNERIVRRRLSPQTIYDILKRRAAQAGVNDFSPHDFRRTFVGDMLERGVDIATVANIAGHASVDTTRRYDRRPEETKKKAAQVLDFPLGE
jgi:integrase